MVFPRLSGWVGTIVNDSTQHRRGRWYTAFSYEKAYETILTLSLTKQALRASGPHSAAYEKSLAFESPTARRTVLDLFAVSLARSEIIEEHPSVLAFHPPKLSPKPVRLAARTI